MVVEPGPNEMYDGLMPTTIAIVELDDGRRIFASIEGEVLMRPGQPVCVRFHPANRDARFPLCGVVGSITCDCRRQKTQPHEPPPRQHTQTAGDVLEWFLRRRVWATLTYSTGVARSR
jgi:hypothetical protein